MEKKKKTKRWKQSKNIFDVQTQHAEHSWQDGDTCAHLAQLFRVLMQLLQDGEGLLLGAVL